MLFLRKTKRWKCSWGQSKNDGYNKAERCRVGWKDKASVREAATERGERERWITAWQVKWKSRRGCLQQCEECVRCGVAQHSVWVIHHANTAGGHSLAQRYAEQEENNVLRLHPLNLIETHSTGATFTHPPHAHFINLVMAFIFSEIIPENRNRKQTHGFSIMVGGGSAAMGVSASYMLLCRIASPRPQTSECRDMVSELQGVQLKLHQSTIKNRFSFL